MAHEQMETETDVAMDTSAVSNLAITDHLPADIIRSLWLVQSLGMQRNELSLALDDKLGAVGALVESEKAEQEVLNAQRHRKKIKQKQKQKQSQVPSQVLNQVSSQVSNQVLESADLSEDDSGYLAQRRGLFAQCQALDAQITRLHEDSVNETEKIKFFLENARKSLVFCTYELIQSIFTFPWKKDHLVPFIENSGGAMAKPVEFAPEQIERMQQRSDSRISTEQFCRIVRENSCFQQQDLDPFEFPDYKSEFQDLIRHLIDTKNSKQLEKYKESFLRKQKLLDIFRKNDSFDRRYHKNRYGTPAVKLVIKNPNKLGGTQVDSDKVASNTPTTPKLKIRLKTPSSISPKKPIESRSDSPQSTQNDSEEFAPQPEPHKLSDEDTHAATGKEKASPGEEAVETNKEVEEDEEEEVYCICRTGSSGKMIACDDDDCKYVWYHFKCLKLPSNFSFRKLKTWYCPECSARREKAANSKIVVPVSQEVKQAPPRRKVHYEPVKRNLRNSLAASETDVKDHSVNNTYAASKTRSHSRRTRFGESVAEKSLPEKKQEKRSRYKTLATPRSLRKVSNSGSASSRRVIKPASVIKKRSRRLRRDQLKALQEFLDSEDELSDV